MTPASSSQIDTIRKGARERVFEKLVHFRSRMAPVLATAAATLAVFDETPWRRIVLACTVVLLVGLTVVEAIRHARHGIEALQLPHNIALMAVGQMMMVLATGGLFSPVLPAVMVGGVITSILVERRQALVILFAVPIPAIWAAAFLHTQPERSLLLLPAFLGDASVLERGPLPWVTASFVTFFFLGSRRIGELIRASFERLFDQSLRERDQSLKLYREQAQSLVALSGELAHELKNPLASIKGLGGLIAKEVEGKTAERLGVLRGEVDRMQAIVEDLLNFSRPLVPLTMERIDLAELARDVARLHEGATLEREIEVRVSAGSPNGAEAPFLLEGDVRKIRQVLINLIQNAVEASPPRGVIRVEARRRQNEAVVWVDDEGEGIDPRVVDRLFEPGATSKAHGSGLGLVVARSLARQHGGELTLGPRDGGGCRAELRLPWRAAGVRAAGASP